MILKKRFLTINTSPVFRKNKKLIRVKATESKYILLDAE